jgi:hypothetical protein
MRTAQLSIVALVLLSSPGNAAHAGVVFFTTQQAFDAATSSGYVAMGVEDWSSAGNASIASVAEPLRPGVASGVFPHGTNAATGMTVQSNSHVTSGDGVAPGAGLFYAPTGFTGLSGNQQPSNQLSANAIGASFDMLFASVGDATASALAFTPTYYRLATSDTGTLTVKVFDESNGLLGTTTIPNVADALEDAFLGIQTTDGDVIGRINVWAGATDTAGADNIEVYTVPEISAAASGLVAVLVLGGVARTRAGSKPRSWITRAGASARATSSSAGV